MEDTKKLYITLSTAATTTTTIAAAQDPILKDPTTLCETLFDQFILKYHEFFSALVLHDCSQLWPRVEHLSLLLRCSLVVLTLPYSDQRFLINKCHCILRILKSFLSVDLTQLHDGTTVLLFRSFVSDTQMELSDSCRPFLCRLLEVFADELLRHQMLRRYLMSADSVFSDCKKVFVCGFTHDEIASVLEVISAHFILSASIEKTLENFLLCLHHDRDIRFHELGLGLAPFSALTLLLDPVVYCAPKMFQVHVISLVFNAIGSVLSSENLTLDMRCYLMAFEKSVSLYSMQVSSLQMDGFCIEVNCAYNQSLFERGHSTFESYIQEGTRNRLNQVLSKSNNSSDSYCWKISSKAKADLLAESIKYMKERQYIFPDSCRDKAVSTLDYIINQTFSQDAARDVLYVKKNTSAEDICLLASILKLMSVSLLQAITCLSNSDSGCLKTTGSSSVRDEYDFLISIIDPFQKVKFSLPFQTLLYDMMKSQQTNYKVSKSVLVHFSGLLSLSFYNDFDVLATGCISVIMVLLLFMFIYEDGDLVDLGLFRGPPLHSCSSEILMYKSEEGAINKQSIYKIAAEFHRIRTLNSRTNSIVADGSAETCNGEWFLHCILPKKDPDYDELADFHDCRKGKDYFRWANNRKKYRKWKLQRKIESKKAKKERVWKSLRLRKLENLP